MTRNVSNNQNVSFGKRFNPVKTIVDSSAAKVNPRQLLGNEPKKELEALKTQIKIADLESKLDVTPYSDRAVIDHLKEQIAKETQKLNLFA